MICEGCLTPTSVATFTPDSTGLMRWWCTACAERLEPPPTRSAVHLEAEIAALKSALREACDGWCDLVQSTTQHDDWRDDLDARKATELRRLAEGT